ncbi:DUF1289 domain-containing protein [Crenobacter sp. SG2305]|uniref:DUF1289 domain-containing protein n=1 Tax=Crenobacter oryzisoli TaxID=3056844 RepID=UPI0025AA36AB|nr:DUF1289 domain-containing protein [Crenobacter sp. SG2305]MDN0084004.1 DUF1289 domain-containing protein [Crenobacter sp. SG2305]
MTSYSTDSDSPCIALCSTALGDNVCRGCGRTFIEVAEWSALPGADKAAIWDCLPARRQAIALAACLGRTLEQLDVDEDGTEWARLTHPSAGVVQFALRADPDGWRLWARRAGSPSECLTKPLADEAELAETTARRLVGWLRGEWPAVAD